MNSVGDSSFPTSWRSQNQVSCGTERVGSATMLCTVWRSAQLPISVDAIFGEEDPVDVGEVHFSGERMQLIELNIQLMGVKMDMGNHLMRAQVIFL